MEAAAAKILAHLASMLKDEEGRQKLGMVIGVALTILVLIAAIPSLMFSVLFSTNENYFIPCPEYTCLTDKFGARTDPLTGLASHHNGLDFAAADGTDVVASKSGKVIEIFDGCTHNYGKSESCGCGNGYGNYIKIKHSDNSITVYAHLSQISVETDDYIQQGKKIGEVGSTGKSTGYHLHFEIIVDGNYIDPEPFFFETATTQQTIQ